MFLQMLENMGKMLTIPHQKKKQMRKYLPTLRCAHNILFVTRRTSFRQTGD